MSNRQPKFSPNELAVNSRRFPGKRASLIFFVKDDCATNNTAFEWDIESGNPVFAGGLRNAAVNLTSDSRRGFGEAETDVAEFASTILAFYRFDPH